MFCFLVQEACVILVPWPGIQHVPPALEGELWTTGPQRRSLNSLNKQGTKKYQDLVKAHLRNWVFIGNLMNEC